MSSASAFPVLDRPRTAAAPDLDRALPPHRGAAPHDGDEAFPAAMHQALTAHARPAPATRAHAARNDSPAVRSDTGPAAASPDQSNGEAEQAPADATPNSTADAERKPAKTERRSSDDAPVANVNAPIATTRPVPALPPGHSSPEGELEVAEKTGSEPAAATPDATASTEETGRKSSRTPAREIPPVPAIPSDALGSLPAVRATLPARPPAEHAPRARMASRLPQFAPPLQVPGSDGSTHRTLVLASSASAGKLANQDAPSADSPKSVTPTTPSEPLAKPGVAGTKANKTDAPTALASKSASPQTIIRTSSMAADTALASKSASPQTAVSGPDKTGLMPVPNDWEAVSPPRQISGTASAKNSPLMKNTEDMIHSGDRSEKTLPTTTTVRSAPADNAGSMATLTAMAARKDSADPAHRPIQISEGVFLADLQTRSNGASLREAAPTPPLSTDLRLDQVQQKILEGVVELRRIKVDAMTVVIKPDARTELSVLVHLRGGQIEVDAQCRRGDYTGWQAQWHQLQHTLAPQGIRLGGLQDFTQPDWSQQAHSGPFESPADHEQSPGQFRRDPRDEALIELKDHQPQPPSKTAHAVNGARRWESWA